VEDACAPSRHGPPEFGNPGVAGPFVRVTTGRSAATITAPSRPKAGTSSSRNQVSWSGAPPPAALTPAPPRSTRCSCPAGLTRRPRAGNRHAEDRVRAGRLTKGELDLRVGQAFTARTHAELAAVTVRLPAEPTTAKPPAHARPRSERPVLRPGPCSPWRPRFARAYGRSDSSRPGPGIPGAIRPRSRLAGLPGHLHLPVRGGHDLVAKRGGAGRVVLKRHSGVT